MPSDSFPSFRKQRFVQPLPQSVNDASVDNGSEDGEIIKLYKGKDKYRADVRLINGPILEKVRLVGPFYGNKGYLHGHKPAYLKGQRVKITYLGNRRDCPVADVVYSLAAGEKESTYLDKNLDYDPEEVSTGHESGHKTIWDESKVKFQDKLKRVYLEIDYDLDVVTIKTPQGKVEISNSGFLVELQLSKAKVSNKEILLESNGSSFLVDATKVKIDAPKFIVTNGQVEFDVFTHLHTSGAPGTPTSKATNKS